MNAHPQAPPDRRIGGARPRRYGRGFTMVEVLITATVTLIAITGLGTLQMLTLRAVGSALDRSQGTALAYEIIDRLRLNRGASAVPDTALGGGYDGRTLCNGSARRQDDAQACGIGAPAAITGTDSVAFNLRAWWTALDNAGLTHWYAGIQRRGQTFTIAVQWDDARAQDESGDSAGTRSSCLGSALPPAVEEICVMTQL